MIQELEYTTKLKRIQNQQDKVDVMNEYAWNIRRSYPSKSLEIAIEAFEISSEIDYKTGLAYSLKNSGKAYYLLSIYESGIIDLNKARNLFNGLNDKESESDCLHYLGNIYHSIEEFELSIDLYEKSKLLSIELKDQRRIAYNLGSIGLVHFLCKNQQKAQNYLFQTYEILFDLDDTQGLADVLNNIGKNHFELDEIDQSFKCFKISLSLSNSINHSRGISNALKNLGKYYNEIGEIEQTFEYFEKALEMAENLGEKSLIAEISKNLSNSYEKMQEYDKALFYYKKYDALKIEILKTYNINNILSIQIQFDLEQVEREKEIFKIRNNELSNFQKVLEEKNTKLELLSLVASQSDNIIIIMDAFGEINFVNDSFVRFNEANLEDLKFIKGKTIFEISNNPDIRILVDECVYLKKSISYESLNISPSGRKVWGSALLTPVFNPFGELTNLIIVENDITDRIIAAEIIDQKNSDITSSITYAKRIQEAILPDKGKIGEYFLESFIVNQPKDIVSGDFYWYDRLGDHEVFAIADCTGHGVPGAFMSMIGINLLTQIVNDSSVTNPAKVLGNLDKKIKKALNQTGDQNETTDGMDIAFFEFSLSESIISGNLILNFASAYRPIWLIRNNEFFEYKPDKFSIGGDVTSDKIFTNHSIKTQKGDAFYVFTDGCIDLFGGDKGKKFRTNGLKKLLLNIHQLPMMEQEDIIAKTLNEWKGELEQVDDILIMGFRIK